VGSGPLSPSFLGVIAFRFVLGFGVGGDYPVQPAVAMIESPNRKEPRGKPCSGWCSETQALGPFYPWGR